MFWLVTAPGSHGYSPDGSMGWPDNQTMAHMGPHSKLNNKYFLKLQFVTTTNVLVV